MNTQNSAPMTGAELETMRRAIGWTVGELADRSLDPQGKETE